MSQKIERKFTKPCTISNYLKCSICFEVFLDPIKLSCGHTICKGCKVSDETQFKCPICRQKIREQYTGIDRIATNMVNELEVKCPHPDCPWRGQNSMLNNHYEEFCVMKVVENKKQEEMDDDEIQEKVYEKIPRGSLTARILSKTKQYKELMEFSNKEKKKQNLAE